MDLGRWRRLVTVLMAVMQLGCAYVAFGNLLLSVKHKFAEREKQLAALKAHDIRRHARILSSVDLPLGGDSDPESVGLYFTKIGLGTPSKDYYVQVDTGSDIAWVNCVGCINCPRKTDLSIQLRLYDPSQSSTSKVISCDEDLCSLVSQKSNCQSGSSCQYVIVYGDGSTTTGYYVRDAVQLDQVTGNHQTGLMNGTLIFGCGSKQSGQLGGSQAAVDGILGFGQSNSSFISQLAVAGKVKRTFSHCLDNVNGGGIFAIGDVVSPRVKTTPMVPNQAHYNVVLKEIEVGGSVLDLPTDVFDAGVNRGAIIDCGTTLVYLPHIVYESLMNKILVRQQELELHTIQESFTCFHSTKNINDGFPSVSFNFEGSLSLTVSPLDYIFQYYENIWCFGWQNGGSPTKDGSQLTLLGDMVLSNKFVMYDIENQVIGWTDYNCSSSINVKDEASGGGYTVGAHNLSSSSSLTTGKLVNFLFLLIALGPKFL